MSSSRQEYIEAYSELAKVQMRRYGIPASVTLAQAIIESANGKSTLSNVANNHFGIKGDFHGNYVLADDDKPNEHFKKYDNVGQSYEDHSKVLMNDRYRKLTKDLTPDDYRDGLQPSRKADMPPTVIMSRPLSVSLKVPISRSMIRWLCRR